LALRELDVEHLQGSAQSSEARELNQLEMYLANNHPDAYEAGDSAVTTAMDLIKLFSDGLIVEQNRVDDLARDIERLQNDFEREAADLLGQIAQNRSGYEHKVAELVTLMAEQDRTIQSQRAETQRLTTQLQDVSLERAELDRQVELAKFSYGELAAQLADAQARVIDLTAQPEAAKVRPVMRTILAAPIPPITDDDDDPAGPPTSTATNGNGYVPTAIDWRGLDSDNIAAISDLHRGDRKWLEVPRTGRRAICLYAVGAVAQSTDLTMAAFDEAKPWWMPSAKGISALFAQRWSTVVENANRVWVQP
jgi:hypothetical protein